MAIIYSNIPNSLTVGVNAYATPVSLAVQYLPGSADGIILTGYQLTNEVRTKKQYALSWAVYYYVFGPALTTLEVQGTAFNRRCGSNTDGVYNLITFLLNYRVSNPAKNFPKLLVQIDVNGTLFRGALEAQVISADPRTPLLSNFKLVLVGGFVI